MESKKNGFTLIEILVVVSIIAILSTIIFAALYSARDEARDKVRISATEQLKLGIRLYKEAHGAYPLYPDGVEIGVGNSIDDELEPFLSEVKADPLSSGPNSEYGYWYYSNFNCDGDTHHVVVAKKMELPKNGNFDTVCSGSAAFIEEEIEKTIAEKFIPTAYAGGGGGGGGGTPAPCRVDAFTVTPTTVPQRGGTVRLVWNTSDVKDNGVTITPHPGSGLNRDDSRYVNVLQTTTFTLTGDGTSGRPDCTATVTVTAPTYAQSTYQYGGSSQPYSQSAYSVPYAQATYSWGSDTDAVYVTLID